MPWGGTPSGGSQAALRREDVGQETSQFGPQERVGLPEERVDAHGQQEADSSSDEDGWNKRCPYESRAIRDAAGFEKQEDAVCSQKQGELRPEYYGWQRQ